MDSKDAAGYIEGLKKENEYGWIDPCHQAFTKWRRGVIEQLQSEDPYAFPAMIEVFFLNMPFSKGHNLLLDGIVRVNDRGIWFNDADGDVDEPVWRSHFVPWHQITGLIVHQAS